MKCYRNNTLSGTIKFICRSLSKMEMQKNNIIRKPCFLFSLKCNFYILLHIHKTFCRFSFLNFRCIFDVFNQKFPIQICLYIFLKMFPGRYGRAYLRFFIFICLAQKCTLGVKIGTYPKIACISQIMNMPFILSKTLLYIQKKQYLTKYFKKVFS